MNNILSEIIELINSKNYLKADTVLEEMVVKDPENFILNKIRNAEGKVLDDKFINFSFVENENKINLFFDKKNYYLVGWQSIDIYQNLSITFISSIVKNIEIDENLFKLPKQN